MASSTVQQNLIPNQPSFKDLLDLVKKNILLSLNAHHIGTVDSFDPTKQTASATVNYKKTFFEPNPVTGVYEPVLRDYPVLLDCPVIVLGGGAGALTFPIQKGDECLVLFNDRDLDNWLQGSSNSAVATPRLHSFSDGIILVGLRSYANSLEDYDTTRAVLRNDQALVGVGPEKVKIANDQFTLNGVLQELTTELQNLTNQLALLTVICAAPASPSSVPVNAAAITAIGTQINATATKIAGLLE